MIYLWVDGEGWKKFELSDSAELEKRRIAIGPGAWIGSDVMIFNGAKIGADSVIFSDAQIGRDSQIENYVEIGSWAHIGEGARIDISSKIGDWAHIGEGAHIQPNSWIGKNAFIGDYATPTNIKIIGSKHPVYYWGEDRIDIGCQSRSIDGWTVGYKKLARQYGYDAGDIAEYRRYVDLIRAYHLKDSRRKME
jgi:UDP-3-O-[3-hydroxymyristoyl] glucosamine N-acyltransferase